MQVISTQCRNYTFSSFSVLPPHLGGKKSVFVPSIYKLTSVSFEYEPLEVSFHDLPGPLENTDKYKKGAISEVLEVTGELNIDYFVGSCKLNPDHTEQRN